MHTILCTLCIQCCICIQVCTTYAYELVWPMHTSLYRPCIQVCMAYAYRFTWSMHTGLYSHCIQLFTCHAYKFAWSMLMSSYIAHAHKFTQLMHTSQYGLCMQVCMGKPQLQVDTILYLFKCNTFWNTWSELLLYRKKTRYISSSKNSRLFVGVMTLFC